MKKVCKSMLVVFIAVFMVLAVTACGGSGSGAPSIVGTWKMQFDSSKLPEEQKAQASMYEALMGAMDMSLTFSDNGKVSINASAMGQSSSAEGTYTFDGTTVKLTDPSGSLDQTASSSGDSSPSELKLVDGKLVIVGAEYMSFVKQ